jgi:phage tail sheath protein FI
MTVTSYPGVYVEEIAGGVRPLAAAGTSTAAFFGVAERGPIGEVKKVFSFDEFQRHYGAFRSDGQFLAHGVYQFFGNGGKDCYVGRVATNFRSASVTVFDRTDPDANKRPSLTIKAISPGDWGNTLMARIDSDAASPNVFNLTITDEVHDPALGETTVVTRERFEGLSMDPDAPRFVETIVNSSSGFVRVEAGDNADSAIRGYSQGALIVGADNGADFIGADQRKFRMNLSGDGWRTVNIATAMTGRNPRLLEDVRVALEATIQGLPPLRASTQQTVYRGAAVAIETPDPTKPNERRLRVTSGRAGIDSRVEILPADSPAESLAGALGLGVQSSGIEVFGHSPMRPVDSATDDPYLLGDDRVDTSVPRRVAAVTAGDDGDLPQPQDYKDALRWLDKVYDVSLIAVPGVGSTFLADAGMAYCKNRPLSDCFYIADMPSFYDTLDEAKDYADHILTPNSYGAVYFPWLKMPDPTGQSPQPIVVPPSGFVAGLYAQTDSRRGVWKAPAGLEAQVSGSVGMTVELTDQEQGDLNKPPKSVCVIRKFQNSGLVLWGARTLSTDPEYKYIPVRRTAIMLRKSIYDGIQWAVFEGNDERLWSSLRVNIESFMNGLFRANAFQGSKASDAYFVRCGLGDTMTQGDIDRGEVIVLVGFAPLKPAEFVIVRIQQKVGQSE